MGEFRMPSLGADMEHGTVLEWRVGPGDVVHRGDVVAVVDTDKADIDVEVFEDGVVEELLVEVGRQVDVGTPLARLAPAEGAKGPATAVPPTDPQRVRASPYARRRAAEQGLDLTRVTGSGPDGAVRIADLAIPAADAAAPSAPRRVPDRSAARQAVADLMARSKREIPHYYLARTIDLSAALAWLTAQNERRPVTDRILPAALLLKATALAATEVPALNGHWRDGFEPSEAVDLGVAVSLRGGGLVAPTIPHAEELPLDGLMTALRDLVGRARSGRLRSSEMVDPSITVTNLGDEGADEVLGVIYPPQVALVGFGRIAQRPWAAGGMLGVRPTVRASLAADHRATDGHEGSRLLAALARRLETPEDL